MLSPEAAARARPIRLVLLDADGILTDGRIVMGPNGDEWKCFDARDGLGIKIGQAAGLAFGIISGRRSPAVERRAQELRLEEIHQGVADKLRVFEAVLARQKLEFHEAAFFGDDLVDVPVLRRAGFAATVPDAAPEVLRHAHVVTQRPGGRGAVRELVELLLRAQGRWDEVLLRYGAT